MYKEREMGGGAIGIILLHLIYFIINWFLLFIYYQAGWSFCQAKIKKKKNAKPAKRQEASMRPLNAYLQ